MSLIKQIFGSSKIKPIYVLFALFILVPNLVLGIFGFEALKRQQKDAEAQMKAAYQTVIRAIMNEVNKEIKLEETKLHKLFTAQNIEEIIEKLDSTVNNDFFKAFFFVDKSVTMKYSKNLDSEFRKSFDKECKNELLLRLNNYVGEFPTLFSRVTGIGDADYNSFYCFKVYVEGSDDSVGHLLALHDDNNIEKYFKNKQFAVINLEEGVNLKLITKSNTVNVDNDVLFVEDWIGEIFPYWSVAVKVADIEEFSKRAKSNVTIFSMLFGVFLPFIGIAITWLLWRLIKEMKLTHLKTDFISRVTHELKTPLTSIKMFSEMLEMDSVPEEQKVNSIRIIQRETERLTKLVDRVLNFSKLESRNKVFSFASENIENIVVETIKFFEKQVSDKDFRIKRIVEYKLPAIMVDKDGIREILLNLIENSFKYSSLNRQITVRIFKTDAELKIIVSDKGFGIPREDLDRIFEKFYRVDDQINRGIDGTGLGLSICREIAKAHGGEINVESERGVGSKFIVSIPLNFKPASWAKHQTTSKSKK